MAAAVICYNKLNGMDNDIVLSFTLLGLELSENSVNEGILPPSLWCLLNDFHESVRLIPNCMVYTQK